MREEQIAQLNHTIKSCTLCPLRANATAPVTGFGSPDAKYVIIGEAPGSNEDKHGVPFVGQAGKRLNQLLDLAGIDMNDCYLTNVCRCQPEKNRTPKKAEIRACQTFLWRELEIIQPERIYSLGSTPLSLFSTVGVSQAHGTMEEIELAGKKVPLYIHYHPAASFRRPRLWADILEDWEFPPKKIDHDFILAPQDRLNLQGMPIAAVDTETDGSGGIGQWSVAYRDGEGRLSVAPFYGARKDIHWGDCSIVFHNAKYDVRELIKQGMEVPKNYQDTMIMGFCLGLGKQAPKDEAKSKSGSNMVGGLGLKYLARRHLGMKMKTWQEVHEHPELVPEYNANDSVATYLLAEQWLPKLPKHYFDIDMPLLPVIIAIEDRGIQVDPAFLRKYAETLDKQLAEIKLPFEPFSNQEIQSYVYGTLGVEPWRFTTSGAPSVDAEALASVDDPVVKDLIRYKEIYSERNTYAKGYMRAVDIEGRIHTELKQTSTSTGRLSSANPNLQNVVKESDMRKLFVAPRGKKIVRLDYKGIEFGSLAVLAKDEELINAFLHGDVHQETATALGVDRNTGKHINFLMQNGGTAWGMSAMYGLPISLTKEYFKKYFERFPALKRFQDETVARAYETKHVTGYFGRTRRMDALFAKDWRIRQAGENEAKTMPMQNLAAEIVKKAMIDLHYKYAAPILLQIHDELLFEVDEKDAKEYAAWLKEYVPKITPIDGVEFPVEVGVGDNWHEAGK